MHIDWFAGLIDNYYQLDPAVPEQIELRENAALCAYLE